MHVNAGVKLHQRAAAKIHRWPAIGRRRWGLAARMADLLGRAERSSPEAA
jgi:hypothetical protein